MSSFEENKSWLSPGSFSLSDVNLIPWMRVSMPSSVNNQFLINYHSVCACACKRSATERHCLRLTVYYTTVNAGIANFARGTLLCVCVEWQLPTIH